jgi:hypothetical protein
MSTASLLFPMLLHAPVVALSSWAPPQNLLVNGDFELDANLSCGVQGQMPDPWIQYSTPDVYTFDCVTLPGLQPSAFGNFTGLMLAASGSRFAAGWGSAGEAFGTTLSGPVLPGVVYSVSGSFTKSRTHSSTAPYVVYLSADANLDRGTDRVIGEIGDVAVVDQWRPDMFLFLAPSDALQFTHIFFDPMPGQDCYVGADQLVLRAVPIRRR